MNYTASVREEREETRTASGNTTREFGVYDVSCAYFRCMKGEGKEPRDTRTPAAPVLARVSRLAVRQRVAAR
ncbi:hypothetical protein E2C01_087392 [Portunus trituberculatus]|uniref:Uncharacterized protein n=1 Tax=Portunus trituberculatus TaxID=210409 RepID=A0A5B7J375_PORTR|nr:hypothetical protein [Portunus trituberculatus]